MRFTLVLTALLLLAGGCDAAPAPRLTLDADPRTVPIGQTIAFHATCSADVLAFTWSLPDSLAPPVTREGTYHHIFTATGVRDVAVTATLLDGQRLRASVQIAVVDR